MSWCSRALLHHSISSVGCTQFTPSDTRRRNRREVLASETYLTREHNSMSMEETPQDLVLDTTDTPPLSGAQEVEDPSSPSPPRSQELMLSLGDLSHDGVRDGQVETNDIDDEELKSNEEEEPPLQRQAQARRGQVDRDAKRMETQLQRNLKQQQAHYARQRKLFENLRTNTNSSPSSDGNNSPQSSDTLEPLIRQHTSFPKKHADATKSRFHKEGLKNIEVLPRQRSRATRDKCIHHHSSLRGGDSNDDDDDSHAQNMLRRIKEKARAEFHRHHRSTGEMSTEEIGVNPRFKAPAEFFEEMQQQEVSNDALRRQMELLRRLQVENNRFRQEARSLRERNAALKERDEVRECEVKRLRDEVSELDAKVQRDQIRLATAAQTAHKLKATQKRLRTAQGEIRDFQTALQEARNARDQLQTESQVEISDLVLEVKRWKRNTKQLRHQENRSAEEIEFYKKAIADLEEEGAERRSQLKDAKCEIAELTAAIEEKSTQCESVEASAADCVKRMEEGLEALQKTHTHEREKRKKVENVRGNLQMQLERMQAENALLLDKQRELERQLTLFQEHWKERKQAYQDQLQRFAVQLEEHVSKHKSDATTIGNIREEYEALESRLEVAAAAATELKAEVAEEARTTQKQIEALRKYVERALHDTNGADGAALEAQVDSGRSRREGIWQEVPGLQVIQAAISALRSETMNIVHEFQHARHLVRQQGSKITLAVNRATELEHLRAEDAAKMKELCEQRKLAEQAREIVSQEKMEVLKWSEQTCAKSEGLEAELKKCGQLILRQRKELRHALETEKSWDVSESVVAESLARSFSALEKEMNALVSMRDHWRTECEKQCWNVKEVQSQVQSLEKESATKADEFKQMLEEVELVHSKNTHEQKLHFEQCIADVESERTALEAKLQKEITKFAEEEENNAKMQQVVDGFEEDLPVFATILHLFVLVVQPLILQVSDLLAQKRYLSRENAEFVQAHEQIECIGQVLKEMVPAAPTNQEKVKERQRRRVFRRVIIAIFALNRFQHIANATKSNEEGAHGIFAPLKIVKSRKRLCTLSSQPTVIKVLSPQETLSRFSLRPLLERLKKMGITEKVAEVMELNSTQPDQVSSSLGNLILKVVMAINPASKELLVANTSGGFHCQALLERRRLNKKRSEQHGDMMAEYGNIPPLDDDIPTVALIRKRILALGKRVEDLHYQRNSLQKENYEFQFQLDQQATSLKDMDVLIKKTADLQDEMAALRSQSDQELQRTQDEHQAKKLELQSKADELVKAQVNMEALQAKVSDASLRIEQMESEKVSLRRELEQLKSSSIEEEEKADKSKAAARRQEDEVRSLKQAVKKAHELYQKVSWQLEQEVQEKSALQTVVNHLRRQQDEAERELRNEKLRELEKSFNESDDDDLDETTRCGNAKELYKSSGAQKRDTKSTTPTMKTKRKTSFSPTTDMRRRCENSLPDDSDQSECGSPSSPVSPLPPRVHSSKSRCSEDENNFLSEWQQLVVSRALSDTLSPGRAVRFQGDTNDSCKASPVRLSASPTNSKSRRRTEVDKVNAAVHDYMDRIDDKLSKMYGIPPSSAIQRRTSKNIKALDNSDDDVDWEVGSSKANEVRAEQYHADIGPYLT